MAVAETYDVLVTLPEEGAFEFRATAQDGSGHVSAFIGSGDPVEARDVPKPDYYRNTSNAGCEITDPAGHPVRIGSLNALCCA